MKKFTPSKKKKKKKVRQPTQRFPKRGGDNWEGPLVDYKEVELLRKFMTTSNKLMSRKRAGTSAREQHALQKAAKRARFIALVPFTA